MSSGVGAAPNPVPAGVHLVPNEPGVVPDPNNPNLFKTPPLSNGQTFTVNWAVHTKFAATHWAGVRFRSHVLDSTEVDLTGITI